MKGEEKWVERKGGEKNKKCGRNNSEEKIWRMPRKKITRICKKIAWREDTLEEGRNKNCEMYFIKTEMKRLRAR